MTTANALTVVERLGIMLCLHEHTFATVYQTIPICFIIIYF